MSGKLTRQEFSNVLNTELDGMHNEIASNKTQLAQIAINVKRFGAKGDNYTDDTNAIKEAINHAVNYGITAIFFPKGTYLMSEGITLTNVHSGLRFYGVGFGSCLKLKDNTISEWEGPKINMIHLRDDANGVKNISFSHLHFDGNKANNGNGRSTGLHIYGIGTKFEGIQVDNLWFHDFGADANFFYSDKITISNIHSWNNVGHGLGIAGGDGVVVNNIVAEGNLQYGIDIHGGKVTVNNFYCIKNVQGGMKTSNGDAHAIITNGIFKENENYGFIANEPFEQIFMDNVLSMGNRRSGFYFSNPGDVTIGSIVSLGDNLDKTGFPSINIINGTVKADSLTVKQGGGVGIRFAGKSHQVDYVNVTECDGYGLHIANTDNVTINGGYVFNNKNYGAYLKTAPKTTLNNIKFGGDDGLQEVGVRIDGNDFTMISCDFNDSTTPVEIGVIGSRYIRNCRGYKSIAQGQVQFNGDGTTKRYFINHGLSIIPTFVNATPAHLGMIGIGYSVMLSGNDQIQIDLSEPLPIGTNNVRFFWEATTNRS